MVDEIVLTTKIAAVRDAVDRIQSVLHGLPDGLTADRTAREVIVFNLFVALQECVALAAHWLADEGSVVPQTQAETFRHLAELSVIPPELAKRMAAAAGLRNLIAHRYGALDWARIYELASERLGDLLEFCDALAGHARSDPAN